MKELREEIYLDFDGSDAVINGINGSPFTKLAQIFSAFSTLRETSSEMSVFPRSLMSLADLTPTQINEVVALARRLKYVSTRVLPPTEPAMRDMAWRAAQNPTKFSAPPQSLRNMSIALLFSKRSTRTRVAAETASKLLGGQAIFLGKEDIQLGVNESAQDTARVLSGMCQGIFARVGDHSEIEELAKYAEVPVINALSSLWHPTQVLAELQTLNEDHYLLQDPHTPAPSPYKIPYSSPSESTSQGFTPDASDQAEPDASEQATSNAAAAEHRTIHKRRQLRPLTIAYVGDSANVLHDMLVTYPRLGHQLQIASPPNPRYRAPAPVWDKVVELECDKSIKWTADPREAVQGADVVVTDTWVSMGQEAEYAERVKDFKGYQVTEEMCKGAKRYWRFLHCLPRKSHEVDDEVFYGPRSLVFHEADNRKWTIMALFHIMFGGGLYSALPHGNPHATYPAARKGNKNKKQKKKSGDDSGSGRSAEEVEVEVGKKRDDSVTVGELLGAVEREAEAVRHVKSAPSSTPAPAPTEGKA